MIHPEGNGGNRGRSQRFEELLAQEIGSSVVLRRHLFGPESPFNNRSLLGSDVVCDHTGDDSKSKADVVVRAASSLPGSVVGISQKNSMTWEGKMQLRRMWVEHDSLTPLVDLLGLDPWSGASGKPGGGFMGMTRSSWASSVLLPLLGCSLTGMVDPAAPLGPSQKVCSENTADMVCVGFMDSAESLDGRHLFVSPSALIGFASKCLWNFPDKKGSGSVSLVRLVGMGCEGVSPEWRQFFGFTRKGGSSDKGAGQLQVSMHPGALAFAAKTGLLFDAVSLERKNGKWSNFNDNGSA